MRRFLDRLRDTVARHTIAAPRILTLTAVALVVLALALFFWLRAGTRDATQPVSFERAFELYAIQDFQPTANGVHLRFNVFDDPHFSVPLAGDFRAQKLRLTLESFENIHSVTVYFKLVGKGLSEKRMASAYILRGNQWVFDFAMPDGAYEWLRIDFDGTEGAVGQVAIKEAVIVPKSAVDFRPAVYLFALLFAGALILPGALLFSLLARGNNQAARFGYSFLALSLAFYTVLYLALVLAQRLRLPHTDWIVLAAAVLLGAGLLFAVYRRGRWPDLAANLRGARNETLFFILVVLVSTWVIAHDVHLPFQNLHHRTVAAHHTFGAFSAHDNYFQYVNGKAIADDEPFDKYYVRNGHLQLFFRPQDREILPGVIYAVARKLTAPFSGYVEDSFLAYTLLGICFNAMILFPLAALVRRYFTKTSPIVLLSFLWLNTFVIVNYYFTWYKFAGAALFLSGLLCLLENRRRAANWLGAGVLLGLAANMHGGNALGIPLFFLMFSYLHLRERKLSAPGSYAGPGLLVAGFVALILPWTIVKTLYLPDDHSLLKSFFLAGYSHRDGMWASIKLFFSQVPLTDQIPIRLAHLVEAFRVSEWTGLYKLLVAVNLDAFFETWNQHEFHYLAFTFFPPLFFLLLNRLYTGPVPNAPTAVTKERQRELRLLLATAFATLVAIILAAYGRGSPDMNAVQPMGVILLIDAILIGLLLQARPLIQIAYIAYLTFTLMRLIWLTPGSGGQA